MALSRIEDRAAVRRAPPGRVLLASGARLGCRNAMLDNTQLRPIGDLLRLPAERGAAHQQDEDEAHAEAAPEARPESHC